MSDLADEIHEAKVEALLDMIRRAVAQQDRKASFREIAEAIALDWHPIMQIDSKKRLSVTPSRRD